MVFLPEWCKEKFKEALENFEEQFKAGMEDTGHQMTYEENGEIGEVEYWVNYLVDSQHLDIKLGGWFSHDSREFESIYCSLIIKIDGEEALGENKVIRSYYDLDKRIWKEFRVELI